MPEIDADDFQRRWKAARLSALKRVVLPERAAGAADDDERAWLELVADADRDLALRSVFDHSRALARSAARHHGVTLEVADFARLLGPAAGDCFRGSWEPSGSARRLSRPACSAALGGFGCDFWREAADGVVMGAGDEQRLVRHQSAGHGDPACVDVLFDDGPLSHPNRLAPVPEHVAERLLPVVRLFDQLGASLQLLGLNEGVLHYRIESKDPLCGPTGRTARERLAGEVARRLPGLQLQDTTPLAVYSEGT